VSNLSYQGLTLLFLAMTYGLIVLCASLMGGQVMSVLYVVSGPIATGLFIYLILALLKPERFARISTAGFSWLAISGLCWREPSHSDRAWRAFSRAPHSPGRYT
jgi:K+-transporting ATPase KdpF subunit